MDMSDLAARMLEWEETQRKSNALKAIIEAEVLALGRTQNVGNVRASYSGGRKSYNYEGAISAMGEAGVLEAGALEPYTTTIPATWRTDYRAACKGLGVEDVPFTQSAPSVTLKLQD